MFIISSSQAFTILSVSLLSWLLTFINIDVFYINNNIWSTVLIEGTIQGADMSRQSWCRQMTTASSGEKASFHSKSSINSIENTNDKRISFVWFFNVYLNHSLDCFYKNIWPFWLLSFLFIWFSLSLLTSWSHFVCHYLLSFVDTLSYCVLSIFSQPWLARCFFFTLSIFFLLHFFRSIPTHSSKYSPRIIINWLLQPWLL
jgi:hypothetical protein